MQEVTECKGEESDLGEIFRLAYVSEVSSVFDLSDLQEIGEKSLRRNAAMDITGVLVMDEGRFLQILEGDERAVRDLFKRIALDPRHQEVKQVAGGLQKSRYLSSWSLIGGGKSSVPDELKEKFHALYERLLKLDEMIELRSEEIELLKVMTLFYAVPLI